MKFAPFFVSLIFLSAPISALAVTLYQTNSFDSEKDAWQGGGTTAMSDGGPNGAGDGFLRVISTGGGGGGSRWVTYNGSSLWSGNFQFELADAIRMDVINQGNTNLNLRVAFGDSTGPLNGGTWFASQTPIVITPGTGWTSVLLPISDNDLVRVNGTGDYDDLMSNVLIMRILSSAAPSAYGDVAVLDGGVDNIRAVPEPSGAVLILGAAGAWILRRRK